MKTLRARRKGMAYVCLPDPRVSDSKWDLETSDDDLGKSDLLLENV